MIQSYMYETLKPNKNVRINKFLKIVGYKIHIQKFMEFL